MKGVRMTDLLRCAQEIKDKRAEEYNSNTLNDDFEEGVLDGMQEIIDLIKQTTGENNGSKC
jgi:hypothetical protein